MTRRLLAFIALSLSPTVAMGQTDAGVDDAGLIEAGPIEAGPSDGGPPDSESDFTGGLSADPAVPRTSEIPRALALGVAGNPPFVIQREDGEFEGVSISVWEEVAKALEIDYSLTYYENAEDLVDAVASGEVEGGIGPLSITSGRAAKVVFTQPYYQGALTIAAPPEADGLWSRIKPFLTTAFLGGATAFTTILVVVGFLFWLFERKANPEQFPARPLPGIANGVWLALVTMTTVGYGDRAPVTVGGRTVAGIWMLLSMLTASSLTAFIATALTLMGLEQGTISTAGDLQGRPIAVVDGTTARPFVIDHGGRPAPVATLSDAVRMVEDGGADALVFDRPIVQYHLVENPGVDLVLGDTSYEPVGYGFALPLGSTWTTEIDVVLLAIQEDGRLDRFTSYWLGEGG